MNLGVHSFFAVTLEPVVKIRTSNPDVLPNTDGRQFTATNEFVDVAGLKIEYGRCFTHSKQTFGAILIRSGLSVQCLAVGLDHEAS